MICFDWTGGNISEQTKLVMREAALALSGRNDDKVLFEHELACGIIEDKGVGLFGAVSGRRFKAQFKTPHDSDWRAFEFLIQKSELQIHMNDENVSSWVKIHPTPEGWETSQPFDVSDVADPVVTRMN